MDDQLPRVRTKMASDDTLSSPARTEVPAYRLTERGRVLDPRPGTQRLRAWTHLLAWAGKPGGKVIAQSAVDRENLDSVTGRNLFSWAVREGLIEEFQLSVQPSSVKPKRPRPAVMSPAATPAATHPRLIEVLAPAYGPCRHFASQGGGCRDAVWAPERGHIPRGFIGATGALEDVEVVLVFAEPGTPDTRTSFPKGLTALETIRAAIADSAEWRAGAFDATAQKGEQFHRNLMEFLEKCYPNATASEVSRAVWQTEARLCSIPSKLGSADSSLCAAEYLAKQYTLLSHATWVALGSKAQAALRRLGVPHIEAYAFGRPGCNFPAARPSWERAIEMIKSRRQNSQ
jgi:hypothetical protein